MPRQTEAKEHKCKENIRWNKNPTNEGRDDRVVHWYGKCTVCRKQVMESYYADGNVFDASTGELA